MIETDAVVIGAGPVGLFQVFQLGLQEINAHLIDALPYPGGQCVELYADKPIYDIPGIPVCTGRELVDRLLQQIAPFKTPQHLNQQVQTLERQPDGRFLLGTSAGKSFLTKTVFIAAGVGAFVPRRATLEALAAYENTQVRYHAVPASEMRQKHVVVMGGEEAALETALQIIALGECASVTLLHRADKFKVDPNLEQLVRRAIANGALRLVIGQPMDVETSTTDAGQQKLTALEIATGTDETQRLPLDLLLPRLGLSPKLGPVVEWGLAMDRKQLVVNPETFATNEPGIFAVGDVNHYPGKRKLILCGFHEATLAAFAAVPVVFPDKRLLLQYTTTSPRLHELLGVKHQGQLNTCIGTGA